MENIQSAILAAIEAKPTDFKDAVHAELAQKVEDALLLKKIEISNSFFNNKTEDDTNANSEMEFGQEEENIDEDL